MTELIYEDTEVKVANTTCCRPSIGETYSKRFVYAETDEDGGTFYHTFIRRFSVIAYDVNGVDLEDSNEREESLAKHGKVFYGCESETDVVTHLKKDDMDGSEIDSTYKSVLDEARYATEAEAREVAKAMCEKENG